MDLLTSCSSLWLLRIYVKSLATLPPSLIFRYLKKRHIVIPTEVHQGSVVSNQQFAALIRLGFYLVLFFIYLYM